MPLWTIYHPPLAFNTEALKAGLTKAIRNIYTQTPMAAFYVNALFQPIEPSSFYIGGVSRTSPDSQANVPGLYSSRPFIRITIQNIVRKM
jgi:hypothetical protein